MSLAAITPRQAADVRPVLELMGQTARFVQDPEVQKAFLGTVGACGLAMAALATFGNVCVDAWQRAAAR